MPDNAVWTEWNALIHCSFKLMQDVRFERQSGFKPSWSERVVMKFMIHLITFTNRYKTHRFAPLHLEGETCWRDLIQLPSHSVGEAMQEGLMMEGSFGWMSGVWRSQSAVDGMVWITTHTRRWQDSGAVLDTFGEDTRRVEST